MSAIERSIHHVPQLKRWLDWKGVPELSVAVGLTEGAVGSGRLYNFLPMGESAASPFAGYLDAPFFTEIDRRNADLKLPLNKLMIDVAAETCAAASIFIVDNNLHISPKTTFDLFAWTQDLDILDSAFTKLGSALINAAVIPTIMTNAGKNWTSISKAKIWPKEKFAVITDQAVAKNCGVNFVAQELGEIRIGRLRNIMKCRFESRSSTG